MQSVVQPVCPAGHHLRATVASGISVGHKDDLFHTPLSPTVHVGTAHVRIRIDGGQGRNELPTREFLVAGSRSFSRDPSDIPVLGTAVAAGVPVLVTVDKDLLALGEFQGIAIIKPLPFLDAAQMLLLNEVADVETIDKTWMIATGAPEGPFAILDTVGITTAYNIVNAQADATGDPTLEKLARLLKTEYLDKGKLGKAAGQGFYSYPSPSFLNPSFLRGQ